MMDINKISNNHDVYEYIKNKRWFQNKNDTFLDFTVYDYFIQDDIIYLLLLFNFIGKKALYYFPAMLNVSDSDAIARIGYQNIGDAFYSNIYAELIINNVKNNRVLENKRKSKLCFSTVKDFNISGISDFQLIENEQSNSSFIEKNIMIKNYRYLQNGENPDINMPVVLQNNGFNNVPELYGYIKYSSNFSIYIAQFSEFIENSKDLWSYYTKFITGILSQDIPYDNRVQYIVNLMKDLSEKLGKITGEMHRTLSNIDDNAFKPERLNYDDIDNVIDDIMKNLGNAKRKIYDIIKNNVDFDKIKNTTKYIVSRNNVFKIRVHGDYHLGQVLLGDKLYIIDFEGEPMRVMNERIKKHCALKDVAGMIRSLGYLISFINKDNYINSGDMDKIRNTIKSNFVSSYRNETKNLNLYPENVDEFNELLNIYIFQKASYELLYEMNNRPSWIYIPLNEINSILNNF